MDGLTGFPDAVRSVFPKARVQLEHRAHGAPQREVLASKDRKAVCLRPSRRLLRPVKRDLGVHHKLSRIAFCD